MVNTCSRAVQVAWCVVNPKGPKDAACGVKGEDYRKKTILKGQAVKVNRYSIPNEDRNFRHFACYSDEAKVKYDNTNLRKQNPHCKAR